MVSYYKVTPNSDKEKNSILENKLKRTEAENSEISEKYKCHIEEAIQKVEELNEQIEVKNDKINQLLQNSNEKDVYYANMEREIRRKMQSIEVTTIFLSYSSNLFYCIRLLFFLYLNTILNLEDERTRKRAKGKADFNKPADDRV